jgi:RNA polymerase sigma-70 factor (ECF subfamily)
MQSQLDHELMLDQDRNRVTRVLAGDHDAFTELVHDYERAVFNLTYRMLNDNVEAEDAAQETFLRAFRNLEKYDPSRSFKTWLLSIASHFCIDLIRKRRMSFLSLDEFLPSQWLMISDDDSVEDEAINRERRDWLQEMLTNLRPEERAIIVLRYWHDLSYEEIAQTLDTNRGVIKSRLFRARQALANQLHVDAIVNNFAPVMG